MLAPGKIYVSRKVRLEINLQVDGVDTDPTTLALTVRAPSGTETTYTYSAGSTVVVKTSAGDYYCDVTPDEPGRWWWRWVSTGTTTADASEGNFLVQDAPFHDDVWDYE